jgi:hydrogenase maturation protein HypF
MTDSPALATPAEAPAHTWAPTVLACGAWLKNAACLLVGEQPQWSAPHGDLSDPAACSALKSYLSHILKENGAMVCAVAHDLHPDFYSTQLAVELAAQLGVPSVGVQHHHAHIAAVMAEHGEPGPVIGLALDGVGLGTDGTAWGGELLWVDGNAAWQRLGHLTPLALPGGDRAAREPWRMAASALHALGRHADIAARFAPLVGDSMAAGVQHMLVRRLNCPLTSSAGRWFDAAAGALGLSVRQADEAEAAIALERAAARALLRCPDLSPRPGATVDADNRLNLFNLMPPLFAAQAQGLAEDVDAAAAGFHLALADALADWAQRAALQRGCATVCLGGGCFANRILRERVTVRLQSAGLAVRCPRVNSCGDAGLALGQAWVAQRQLMRGAVLRSPLKEFEPCV